MEGPSGQGCKKDLCWQHAVLVPRARRMHSGCGVAAVQSSYSFICCSAMQTEMTQCGE